MASGSSDERTDSRAIVPPHQVAAVGSVAHSVSRPTGGELTSSKISGSSPGRISATSSSIVYLGWQERMITASPSIVRSTARPSWTRRLSATARGIRIARLFPHLDTRALIVSHFNGWELHWIARSSCFRVAGRRAGERCTTWFSYRHGNTFLVGCGLGLTSRTATITLTRLMAGTTPIETVR